MSSGRARRRHRRRNLLRRPRPSVRSVRPRPSVWEKVHFIKSFGTKRGGHSYSCGTPPDREPTARPSSLPLLSSFPWKLKGGATVKRGQWQRRGGEEEGERGGILRGQSLFAAELPIYPSMPIGLFADFYVSITSALKEGALHTQCGGGASKKWKGGRFSYARESLSSISSYIG